MNRGLIIGNGGRLGTLGAFGVKGGGKDVTPPTVTISSTEISPSYVNPIPLIFTLSEVATDFVVGDITIGAGGFVGNFAGSGINYTADLTVTGTGVTITVDVAANSFHDAAGNGNTAATQFSITSGILFLDEFTTAVDAPIPSPHIAEPGPGALTIVDTGNYLSITGSSMIFANQVANQDPLAYTVGTYVFGAGKTYVIRTKYVSGARMQFGTDGGGINQGFEIGPLNFFMCQAYVAADANPVPLLTLSESSNANIFRDWVMLFSTDRQVFVTGDTVLYIGTDTTATDRLYISRQSGSDPKLFDRVAVAVGNGNLANDFGIATARIASANAGDTISAARRAWVEATRTIATNDVYELMVRRTDDNNCWIVRADQAGSTIKLIEKVGGTETERATAAHTFSNATAYKFLVLVDGANIQVFIDNAYKLNYSAASTGMEVVGVKTSHAVDNFIAWPRKLSSADFTSLKKITGSNLQVYRSRVMNAASPLTTPTYDTSGNAVHPDVLDMNVVLGGTGTWNGKRYWMSMTPYPAGNSAYENPSILCSDDGTTWAEPVGLTNPIDAAPGGGHINADAALCLSSDGTTLWCYYLDSDQSTTDILHARSSTDGVTWSAEATLFSAPFTSILSPSVIYDGTQYVMWCVDSTTNPNTITRRTSASPDSGWSAAQVCTDDASKFGTEPWHICVRKNGSTYAAAVLLYSFKGGFATSSDGNSWIFDTTILDTVGAWNGTLIHRATLAPISSTVYDLWYSAASGNTYRIGRTTVQIE